MSSWQGGRAAPDGASKRESASRTVGDVDWSRFDNHMRLNVVGKSFYQPALIRASGARADGGSTVMSASRVSSRSRRTNTIPVPSESRSTASTSVTFREEAPGDSTDGSPSWSGARSSDASRSSVEPMVARRTSASRCGCRTRRSCLRASPAEPEGAAQLGRANRCEHCGHQKG